MLWIVCLLCTLSSASGLHPKIQRLVSLVNANPGLVINDSLEVSGAQGTLRQSSGLVQSLPVRLGQAQNLLRLGAAQDPRNNQPFFQPQLPIASTQITYEDEAYWAGESIVIADNTVVVLDVLDFTMIAHTSITFGSNVYFTWAPKSDLRQPMNPATTGATGETRPCDPNTISCDVSRLFDRT